MKASSWVNELHSHSIFTLPFGYQNDSPLDELARPPSPALSSIFPQHRSSPSKSLKKSQSFLRKERESTPRGGRKCRVAIARGVDLIVAVGSELRIASLMDVKARCDERDGNYTPSDDLDGITEADLGEYKTLSTPCIKFDIQQLVLNPTSKLLAVVGTHSVAVIVLPRKGWSNSVGRSLECRSLLVGKFYHALPASPSVAQISWHPWGANASSLLVLTSDAILREYAINEDAEEPAQTVSFTKHGANEERGSSSAGGGAFFSGEDVDASKAVAFAFGEGKGDWGPLTAYCLMRNGDIFAICPFLPKKATIPSAYIHSLSSFVSSKLDTVTSPNTTSSSLTPFRPSTANSSALTFGNHSFASSSPSTSSLAVETLYDFQLKYVSSLVKQVASSAPARADDDMEVDSGDAANRLVSITLPAMARSTPASLQGPFLLQPSPLDLPHGLESRACDLAYISYESSGVAGRKELVESGKYAPGLGVFVISYSDGKVDLCLEVEKVEARWGDFVIMDEEDEEVLPSLAVYETIDLGLVQALDPDGPPRTFEDGNHPTIVKDPIYSDTLYLHHSLGAHCLLLSPWLDALSDVISSSSTNDDSKLQSDVERVLRQQQATDVLWILKTVSIDSKSKQAESPVVGLSIINDVYLGYSALLMTSSLQLVGIELSLRVDPSLLPSTDAPSNSSLSSQPTPRGVSSEPPPYLSLLDSPFTIPPPLDKRLGVSTVPRLAIKPPASKSGELIVTAETLRFMGKTVEQFRYEIRDLVASADIVQCRLELQMKELSRQLSKLAELTRLSDSLRKSVSFSAGAGSGGLGGRLEKVKLNQVALLERTDRVLQKLMDSHEPVLSTYEKKWFEELGRLEKEVLRAKGGDGSLERRAEHVLAMFDELKPALEELKGREKKKDGLNGLTNGNGAANGVRKDGSLNSPGGMGVNQMKTFETKLAEEARLISQAREKLEKLTSALASTSLS